MEHTYYYAHGTRVPVTRLHAARVVELPPDERTVSVPGWQTIPLGHKRFQLLVRADTTTVRTHGISRLEELVDDLIRLESRTEALAHDDEERSLEEDFGLTARPALVGDSGGLFLPTGEVVARFPDEAGANAIQAAVGAAGGRVLDRVTFLPNTYLLTSVNDDDGLALANRLVESGAVVFAHPNFIEEMPWRALLPPNALFGDQWHLRNTGQSGGTPGADVSAVDAWVITRGAPEIVVCIMDSGVDLSHEAFSEAGKLVPGFDFEDDDTFPDPTTSSHGTSCAGVAVAPWARGRVVGVAPGCRLMPVRRASISEHLAMAEAFAWVSSHGADVISCSFGYDGRPWILPDVVRATIDQATTTGRDGRGCVIVWAAGNGNEPISSDEWASYDRVLAVGASTDQDRRASYSDFGPELDVCAPSSGGINGITTTANGGYTNLFGGTSSAAPLVAGIAALLLSVNPNLTRGEVHDLLRQSADKIDPANGAYGQDGHSHLYGYGRVNALRALNAIPVLTEILRGSPVASRRQSIELFGKKYLQTRPAGQAILQALSTLRFRILDVLRLDPTFRANALVTLDTAADAYDALTQGAQLQIPDATWDAIIDAMDALVPQERDERREERRSAFSRALSNSISATYTREAGTMAKQSNRYSDERNTDSPEPTGGENRDLDAILSSLSEKLGNADRSTSGESNRSGQPMGVSLESFFEEATRGALRAVAARQQEDRSRGISSIRLPILVGLWIGDGDIGKQIGAEPLNPQDNDT